jgi:hypothetical protein
VCGPTVPNPGNVSSENPFFVCKGHNTWESMIEIDLSHWIGMSSFPPMMVISINLTRLNMTFFSSTIKSLNLIYYLIRIQFSDFSLMTLQSTRIHEPAQAYRLESLFTCSKEETKRVIDTENPSFSTPLRISRDLQRLLKRQHSPLHLTKSSDRGRGLRLHTFDFSEDRRIIFNSFLDDINW